MAYGDIIQEDIVITRHDKAGDEYFDTTEEADIRLEEIRENNEEWSQYFLKQWIEGENGEPQEGDVTIYAEYDENEEVLKKEPVVLYILRTFNGEDKSLTREELYDYARKMAEVNGDIVPVASEITPQRAMDVIYSYGEAVYPFLSTDENGNDWGILFRSAKNDNTKERYAPLSQDLAVVLASDKRAVHVDLSHSNNETSIKLSKIGVSTDSDREEKVKELLIYALEFSRVTANAHNAMYSGSEDKIIEYIDMSSVDKKDIPAIKEHFWHLKDTATNLPLSSVMRGIKEGKTEREKRTKAGVEIVDNLRELEVFAITMQSTNKLYPIAMEELRRGEGDENFIETAKEYREAIKTIKLNSGGDLVEFCKDFFYGNEEKEFDALSKWIELDLAPEKLKNCVEALTTANNILIERNNVAKTEEYRLKSRLTGKDYTLTLSEIETALRMFSRNIEMKGYGREENNEGHKINVFNVLESFTKPSGDQALFDRVMHYAEQEAIKTGDWKGLENKIDSTKLDALVSEDLQHYFRAGEVVFGGRAESAHKIIYRQDEPLQSVFIAIEDDMAGYGEEEGESYEFTTLDYDDMFGLRIVSDVNGNASLMEDYTGETYRVTELAKETALLQQNGQRLYANNSDEVYICHFADVEPTGRDSICNVYMADDGTKIKASDDRKNYENHVKKYEKPNQGISLDNKIDHAKRKSPKMKR